MVMIMISSLLEAIPAATQSQLLLIKVALYALLVEMLAQVTFVLVKPVVVPAGLVLGIRLNVALTFLAAVMETLQVGVVPVHDASLQPVKE